MTTLLEDLMQENLPILEGRVRALESEFRRRHSSLSAKVFGWCGIILSLTAVAMTVGPTSMLVVVPSSIASFAALVLVIGAWGLRSNLRISRLALARARQ